MPQIISVIFLFIKNEQPGEIAIYNVIARRQGKLQRIREVAAPWQSSTQVECDEIATPGRHCGA